MPVSEIKIIKPGTLAIDCFEPPKSNILAMKYFCGIGGGSTVTLLQSDVNVLVDTGFDYETDGSENNITSNNKRLTQALKNAGFSPKEIDILFITHWHADHSMNRGIFKDCEIVMFDEAVKRHNMDFRGVKPGESISDGITVLPTPGHTIDHASLLVETDNLRHRTRSHSGGRLMGIGKVQVIVAGDAIVSPACSSAGKIWHYNQDFYSEEMARTSMKKIQEIADFIIPGHGGIFWNERKRINEARPTEE
jgi:glyoxylase-like metal-dependent hydrolase (beta-lactamase superfamily II)